MARDTAVRCRATMRPDSWVEEEPAAILDEDDLDFLNVEGAAEIVEEGEVGGEQWNVGDIPFATEGI
ncbi:hypothetical protein EJ110_NYTH53954 [Nymphaea thermarum]|nr:hypothetical protein EJ110_NYTH53954 [Nymphaea thermarum]